MNFRIQLQNKIATTSYGSTRNLVIHGSGKRVGNGGANCTFIGVPMMEVVEE